MRKLRPTVLIAWLFCALVSGAAIIDVIKTLAGRWSTDQPLRLIAEAVFGLLPMLFAIPAALIISRHPRNLIGWLLMLPAVVTVASNWITRYLETFQAAPPRGRHRAAGAALRGWDCAAAGGLPHPDRANL